MLCIIIIIHISIIIIISSFPLGLALRRAMFLFRDTGTDENNIPDLARGDVAPRSRPF